MQIQKIEITGFGKFQNFTHEFAPGLNMIDAENGWGKSTMAAFIKAMFYGLDYTTRRNLKENERQKYLPWQGGLFGGSMTVTVEDKTYRVERFFGAKDKEDTFALFDLATGLNSLDYSERLGEELFHLDRAAYEQSSFFTQQDFLPVLNDSLNAGLTHAGQQEGDIGNYEKAYAALEEKMKYYQKTGDRGEIPRLTEVWQEVRTQLQECQSKEGAFGDWKQGLKNKEIQEEQQRKNLEELEAQLQTVTVYETRKAIREQLFLLRQQAGGKEEQLRRTKQEMNAFTSVPAGEEELDRVREEIFHLKSVEYQLEDVKKMLSTAVADYAKAADELAKTPEPGNPMIPYLVVLLHAAAAAVWMYSFQPPIRYIGIALIVAGIGYFLYDKSIRSKKRAARDAVQAKVDLAGKDRDDFKDQMETYQKRVNKMRQMIRETLYFPENALAEDIEQYWKAERKNSQNYAVLQTACQTQETEAARYRELYMAQLGKYSDQELFEINNLEEPQRQPDELRYEIRQAQERLSQLQKERGHLEHRLDVLKTEVERIPELEEEMARVAQKIQEGKKEHALLEKTLKYLKTAREQFQSRYLQELQEGLEKYQRFLEPDGKEAMLDVKLKVRVREGGAARDLDYMSVGWQDLLKIAERFAIVDALYKEEQPVLILDDPFVNLDEKKRGRAMELLQEQAGRRQMIYFTCR